MILDCSFCKRPYCEGCEGAGECWECELPACDVCLSECSLCGSNVCGDCAGHCDDELIEGLE